MLTFDQVIKFKPYFYDQFNPANIAFSPHIQVAPSHIQWTISYKEFSDYLLSRKGTGCGIDGLTYSAWALALLPAHLAHGVALGVCVHFVASSGFAKLHVAGGAAAWAEPSTLASILRQYNSLPIREGGPLLPRASALLVRRPLLVATLSAFTLVFECALVPAALLAYGSELVLAGEMPAERLVAAMLYQQQLQEYVGNLLDAVTSMYKSSGAASAAFALIDRAPRVRAPFIARGSFRARADPDPLPLPRALLPRVKPGGPESRHVCAGARVPIS